MEMLKKTAVLVFFIILLLGSVVPEIAVAQEAYPVRPIKIVVAVGPGSAADLLARILGEFLRQELKAEVIVDYKSGAAGVVGGDFLAKSKPDGYVLGVFQSSILTTAVAISPSIPYDPIKDFTHLANAGINSLALVVNENSQWKSLPEFLSHAKNNPGKVSCGIIGIGSHSHFNLELLKTAADVQFNSIPFKAGSGPAITALLGGHIDSTSLIWPAVAEQVKAKKLRALAATGPIKGFSEVPTFAQLGFPKVNLEVFFGIYGPAKLPKQVMTRLVPALEKGMKDPVIVDKLEKMGFTIAYEGPEELAERIKKELVVVRDVATKASIRLE
jgi:tripartite-type tricarboxylate transporter receptor subunit TctC